MHIKILDIKIDIISKKEVLDKIKDLLFSENNEQYQLVTTNPEFIVKAQRDEEFKNIINNSWLSVADGYGIRLASKYQEKVKSQKSKVKNKVIILFLKLLYGSRISWWGMTRNNEKLDVVKEIITGTDLVVEICKTASVIPAQAGIQKKIFLLGGFGNTAELVAENLKKQFNPSTSLGTGNLTIEQSVFETDDPISRINQFQPDVLFVALNHPRAQKWIDKNLAKMPSVKLAIGVGGAFDYISGKIKRAPLSWRCSFEWVFRLIKQPKRLKRIYNAVIKFPWLVFMKSQNRTQI